MNGLFITGTDTDIGKTFLTAALTKALRRMDIPALGLKPIVCGSREDAEELQEASGMQLSLDEINPLWLQTPLSPYAASMIENRQIQLEPVFDMIKLLERSYPGPFLIEGAGGWLVPITRDYWIRDLALSLQLPVLIVASIGLGTLNHTLLTVQSIRQSGGYPVGIVLNRFKQTDDAASLTNPGILQDLTGLPVYVLDEEDDLEPIPLWLLGSCGVEAPRVVKSS
ncbi:MAG: dethiobiotin synthase [Verrucomicrobiota bacterium]